MVQWNRFIDHLEKNKDDKISRILSTFNTTFLQHDKVSDDYLMSTELKLLEHPPYRLDLVFCIFALFPRMQYKFMLTCYET